MEYSHPFFMPQPFAHSYPLTIYSIISGNKPVVDGRQFVGIDLLARNLS
jgi:hypothetical protein